MDVVSHALWAAAAAEGLRGRGTFARRDVIVAAAAYYAVTLFYPFSEWHFDGVAWTTPAVLAVNWALLAAAGAALWLTRRSRPRGP